MTARPVPNMTVYVITHPEGHTTVRTTSVKQSRCWRELPPGHGYVETEATITWKVARAIHAMYEAATEPEPEVVCTGMEPEMPDAETGGEA